MYILLPVCYTSSMTKVVIEKELGAIPTANEIEVVDILVANGFVKEHVVFLKPQRNSGTRTPDIQIDFDVKWEIKSIVKDGKYTLEHALRHGFRQSRYLIIDIRRLAPAVQQRYAHKIESEYIKRKAWLGAVIVLQSKKPTDSVLTLSK